MNNLCIIPEAVLFQLNFGESWRCSFFDSSSKSILTSPKPLLEMHHCFLHCNHKSMFLFKTTFNVFFF